MDLRSPPAPKRISALIGCVRVSISRSSRKSRRLIQQVCCKTIRSLALSEGLFDNDIQACYVLSYRLGCQESPPRSKLSHRQRWLLAFPWEPTTLSQRKFEVSAC